MRYALFVLALLTIGACSPASPVGFFDMQRVITESREAKAAFTAADKAAEPAHAEAQRAADAVQRMKSIETGYEEKVAKADAAVKAYQEASKKARAEAGAKLDERIAVIVAGLATARRMQIVFGVPGRPTFAAPGLDLTAAVLAALDGETPELAAARAKVKELEAARASPDGGVRHVSAGRVP